MMFLAHIVCFGLFQCAIAQPAPSWDTYRHWDGQQWVPFRPEVFPGNLTAQDCYKCVYAGGE